MRKLLAIFLPLVLLLGSFPLDASTVKPLYGTSNQSITCTITSLATANLRESTAIDNSSNLYLDALVTVEVKSNSSSTSATGYVNVYAYGSSDGGSSYDDRIAGTDGAYTPSVTPVHLALIGVITLNANSKTTQRTFPVAAAFGGQLPQHWGIVVDNESGATLDASTGSAWYQGIQAQSI